MSIRRLHDAGNEEHDLVASEEPLAIRLGAMHGEAQQVAVTMRTPGDDHELAVGWLLAEGIVRTRSDILDVSWCVRNDEIPHQRFNAVTVTLASRTPDLSRLDRHGLISSACGVCGRATLEALATSGLSVVTSAIQVSAAMLQELPQRLRREQQTFGSTGGLHAAARFSESGELLAIAEDVGRHNALDKIVGAALLGDQLPMGREVLLLSGRASYELLQKAVVAGVPVVAALGAPSSLAVDVATAFGITLVGFLDTDRGNVYSYPERIMGATAFGTPSPGLAEAPDGRRR